MTHFLRHAGRLRAPPGTLGLANQADVSQRHLSFIETGRARPRADVVRRIVEALDIPLRDRNRLFEAAVWPTPIRSTRSTTRSLPRSGPRSVASWLPTSRIPPT
jgi:transcriptional regulator with XRE-family HTH domain